MVEVVTLSNNNDKPFEGRACEMCLNETETLTELSCMHKCCSECIRKISFICAGKTQEL